MYRTLDSLQKQSRLPKRAPPKNGVLSFFKVDGEDVNSFIASEDSRLFREKKIPAKPTVSQPPVKTKAVDLPNRPRNQRSLADFSTANLDKQKDKWWKPVLDGTISHSREEEIKSAEAANIEVVANSLENEATRLSQ